MKSSELDYELPPELIAQRPLERRDQSRLLVYERDRGVVRHRRFEELPEVLARLDVERVTLHVGLDTFRPISAGELAEHTLHSERYEVSAGAWERISQAQRVLAVGTTSVRVLESVARGAPLEGRTDLFI